MSLFPRSPLFLAVIFAFVPLTAAEPPAARAMTDVISSARVKEMVLVKGVVERAFDFDTFLIADAGGEAAVSFVGVRQRLKPGDAVLIYGRYRGRAAYQTRHALIEAQEWAPADTPEAQELLVKRAQPAVRAPEVRGAPAEAPVLDVEARLRRLEDMKARGVVTPEEYREQRKRILNDL